MKTGRSIASLCLMLTVGTLSVDAAELDHDGLLHKLVGATIRFQGDGDDVYEYLDPSGEIRGASSLHGKFTAHWRFLDDRTFCFESADPMQSGCAAVDLAGSSLSFHRRDGVIEGPFELLAGNPRGL